MKKFKPIIYCEVTRKKNKVLSLLKKHGYEFFSIINEEKYRLKNNFNGNILAFHKSFNHKKKERWPSG